MTKNLICPAKINLFLEITGKREDSYHTLDMVMHTVSLADEMCISLSKGSGEIKLLGVGNALFPSGENNIAYRAADRYFSAFGIKNYDVEISFDKRVPMSAGLGGGSADAAGVLRALEGVFKIGDKKTIDTVALSLGADVPFCMYGGCSRARGIGEILTDAPELPSNTFIVIVKGKNGVNTAKAYADSDKRGAKGVKDAENVIKSLENGDALIGSHMFNRFEEVVFPELPEVGKIKDDLIRLGAYGALMSGSGSAVYGLFENEKNALSARELFADQDVFSCVARPFSKSDF